MSTFFPASCHSVALFARAWIEITKKLPVPQAGSVALFARAWIEIRSSGYVKGDVTVALFARAWIEIRQNIHTCLLNIESPSLRGRGLK